MFTLKRTNNSQLIGTGLKKRQSKQKQETEKNNIQNTKKKRAANKNQLLGSFGV